MIVSAWGLVLVIFFYFFFMWAFRLVFMVLGIKVLNALMKGLKTEIGKKMEGLKGDTAGKGENKS